MDEAPQWVPSAGVEQAYGNSRAVHAARVCWPAPVLLRPPRRAESALVAFVQGADVHVLQMASINRSQVSGLCVKFDLEITRN